MESMDKFASEVEVLTNAVRILIAHNYRAQARSMVDIIDELLEEMRTLLKDAQAVVKERSKWTRSD